MAYSGCAGKWISRPKSSFYLSQGICSGQYLTPSALLHIYICDIGGPCYTPMAHMFVTLVHRLLL